MIVGEVIKNSTLGWIGDRHCHPGSHHGLINGRKSEEGTFYISAPSLPCYAERKTYR